MKKAKIVLGLFTLFLIITSIPACNEVKTNADNSEKISKDSLELERVKLELEKSKLELEKEKVNQQKINLNNQIENEQIVALVKKAQEFNINPTGVVTAERAFFYSSPEYGTQKKSFLVRGDMVEALRVNKNFIYVEFYSEYFKKTTSGWIDAKDVENYQN